jgi:hypothetical protein
MIVRDQLRTAERRLCIHRVYAPLRHVCATEQSD